VLPSSDGACFINKLKKIHTYIHTHTYICHFYIYNRPAVAIRIFLLRVTQYGTKERTHKEAKSSLPAGNPLSVRISYPIYKGKVCVCYHYLSNFPAVCWFSVHRPQQPENFAPFNTRKTGRIRKKNSFSIKESSILNSTAHAITQTNPHLSFL
jgi:hypothetical protein